MGAKVQSFYAVKLMTYQSTLARYLFTKQHKPLKPKKMKKVALVLTAAFLSASVFAGVAQTAPAKQETKKEEKKEAKKDKKDEKKDKKDEKKAEKKADKK